MTEAPAIRRGDVWLVALDPGTIGSEQRRTRPCVVVQRDAANAASPTTIVVPVTAGAGRRPSPISIPLAPGASGLTKASIALCGQLRAVDRSRLISRLGALDAAGIEAVNAGVRAILDL